MATLTMRIDDRMETELSKRAEATHRTKSDLAREILRRQIAIRRFQDLRAQAIPYVTLKRRAISPTKTFSGTPLEVSSGHQRAGKRLGHAGAV